MDAGRIIVTGRISVRHVCWAAASSPRLDSCFQAIVALIQGHNSLETTLNGGRLYGNWQFSDMGTLNIKAKEGTAGWDHYISEISVSLRIYLQTNICPGSDRHRSHDGDHHT